MADQIRNTHIEVAERLILSYNGEEPFSIFLKKYFSSNKKHGSRDRKQIASLCFGYFRLGQGVSSELSTKEKIELGNLLTHSENITPEDTADPLSNKLQNEEDHFEASKIFPFNKFLSKDIDVKAFNNSFLKQPELFIRIRPGHENTVLKSLERHEINFRKLTSNCIAVNNSTQLKDILKINNEAVIQDYNSQMVASLFPKVVRLDNTPIHIWDCCAASGGKSILAKDYFKNIELTVSDNRKSILHNLIQRFGAAGLTGYSHHVLDLSRPVSNIPGAPFDLIIADLPCSGSGTWARTPEQLSTFKESQIISYAALQRSIILNVVRHLKPEGYLLYITCSVFEKENEENVQGVMEAAELQLLSQQYFKGYEMQADTLFGALMQSS